MKIFGAIAVAALALSFNASAAQVVLLCNSFSTTYGIGVPSPGGTPGTGTISCPGQASLSGISSSIYIYYDADFQNGNPSGGAVNSGVVTWTGGSGFSSSTLVISGNGSSNQPSYVGSGSSGLGLNPLAIVGYGQYWGQSLTDTNGADTQTLTYTNAANGETLSGVLSSGTVGAVSGAVYIVYNYSTGTPEPVSMILFGSGLLAVSLIGRKKFARK